MPLQELFQERAARSQTLAANGSPQNEALISYLSCQNAKKKQKKTKKETDANYYVLPRMVLIEPIIWIKRQPSIQQSYPKVHFSKAGMFDKNLALSHLNIIMAIIEAHSRHLNELSGFGLICRSLKCALLRHITQPNRQTLPISIFKL